ncbi:MAG: hypothetical protein E7Z91_04065 [Cyanobacteria bacterium SIG30]|nr:hypothetical protein [Cyanobacteria bacterium SIG30]
MFRCTECQSEYEIKPTFCDCGNDVFEEFITGNINGEKESFETKHPFLHRFFKIYDPISLSIFLICIILSIVILAIPFKEDKEVILEEKTEQKIVKIKDIDEIWDDGVIKKEEVKPILKSSPKDFKLKETSSKKNSKTTVKKTQPKTSNVGKSVSENKKVEDNKINHTENTKNSNQEELKAKEQEQERIKQELLKQKEQEQKALEELQNQKQFREYKISLRNLLFSKIDFTQIIGDGYCVVTFEINENGKLINKKFVQTSTNDMLNDAVFYAVNTTSSFKKPPSLYKNETLKFTVRFISGQYEVGLN